MEISDTNLLDAVIKIRNCSKTEARRLLASGTVSIDKKRPAKMLKLKLVKLFKLAREILEKLFDFIFISLKIFII